MPWQKAPALQSVASLAANSNGRRLQAFLTPECIKECPKVEDFLKALMTAEDLGEDPPMEKTIAMYCPHEEAISCIIATKVCQDESSSEMAMLPCMCACPGIGSLSDIKTGVSPTSEQCTAINCVTVDHSVECASLVAQGAGDSGMTKVISDCTGSTKATADMAPTRAAPVVTMVLSVLALVA